MGFTSDFKYALIIESCTVNASTPSNALQQSRGPALSKKILLFVYKKTELKGQSSSDQFVIDLTQCGYSDPTLTSEIAMEYDSDVIGFRQLRNGTLAIISRERCIFLDLI